MRADAALPARDTLLDPDGARLVLNSALAEIGAECERVEANQVRYVPQSSITVRYSAEVSWERRRTSTETLVAMCGRKAPDSSPLVEVEGSPVAVWRYPNDPFLPGLAVLSAPGGVGRILDQVGASSEDVTRRVRVYRPGRRAVIELVGPATRVFVKVVRPSRVRRLQEIHKAISGALPIPQSLGWTSDLGFIVLQAMEGETLRQSLVRGRGHQPSGAELWALVAALPELPEGSRSVAGPVSRAADHFALISYVLPEIDHRVEALVGRLGSASLPETTVHGDLHTSQILVDSNSVAGLIDVDSAGRGEPADDMATLIAQVSVLAIGSGGDRFAEYGRLVLQELDRLHDPSDLRRRIAAACLGFATGAFRTQMPGWRHETLRRVELAEQWLGSASG